MADPQVNRGEGVTQARCLECGAVNSEPHALGNNTGWSGDCTSPDGLHGPTQDTEYLPASELERLAGELEARAEKRMQPDSERLGEALVRAAEAGALREAASLLRASLTRGERGE